MAFEIVERDLLARIGRLETKSGKLETPVFLPVVNPAVQPISPREMQLEFNVKALIANAYIIRKRSEPNIGDSGIHGFLDFDGVIMTDSGAYQILIYKDIEVTNEEIIRFQEKIGTDIAVILDLPTGWGTSEQYARHTVAETLSRARELGKIKSRNSTLWVGPIQGGVFLNLVAKSAKAMSKLPFQIHALGSPTPIMEQYLFDKLVNMIMTAKMNLPPDRPLHLFGAGHPFMFSLAVALGCDMFDSAAYAIYAREGRYMTESGTARLETLEYFPCSCAECAKTNPADVKTMPKPQQQRFLARHNLRASLTEIKRIKQAIIEGSLWEHLETRSHSHPALLQALKALRKYARYFEANSSVSKKTGLLFFGSTDLCRPEITRYSKRLFERYTSSKKAEVLLLLPPTRTKPLHKSREHSRVLEEIERQLGDRRSLVAVCSYMVPFGIVPMELDEVYPLSQHEATLPPDLETVKYMADNMRSFIKNCHYTKVVFIQPTGKWENRMSSVCKTACKRKGILFTLLRTAKPWSESALSSLVEALNDAVGDRT